MGSRFSLPCNILVLEHSGVTDVFVYNSNVAHSPGCWEVHCAVGLES